MKCPGLKTIAGKLRTSSLPYLYDVVEGNVPDHKYFRIYGRNTDVDAAVETVWAPGGLYVLPPAPMRMELYSSSVEDDILTGGAVAGTGVHEVEIHYLDTNYDEQEETIELNGQTAVPTIAANILRIQHMHATKVGTGGYAVGNIDIRNTADTPIYKRIPIGQNTSGDAVWTVPNGKTAYITAWQVGITNPSGGRSGTFRLMATCSLEAVYTAGIYQKKELISAQDGSIVMQITVPIKLPAYTDIMITAQGDAGNADAICTCSFEGWYES